MNRLPISFIILLGFLIGLVLANQELTQTINPDCDKYENSCKKSPSTISVIYIKSNGNETYHFLWTFIENFAPVLFLFQTETASAKLSINWDKLMQSLPGGIEFSDGEVIKSLGFEITKLYFANYTTSETLHNLNVTTLHWKSEEKQKTQAHVGYFMSTGIDSGELSFKLDVFDTAGQETQTPQIPFDISTISMHILANNITLPKFIQDAEHTTPFLYADYTLAWSGNQKGELYREVTIDDEYSPGIFERYNYNIKSDKEKQTAYLDWKKVAYYDSSLTFTKSVAILNPSFNDTKLEKQSLLNCYYGNDLSKVTIMEMQKMIFGNPDEDYSYSDNPYVDFSLAIGLGAPPPQNFSLLLKIIIFAGFGLPMAFFLVSIIYTVWRKCRASRYDNLEISQEIS